ncbi:MULTISPECIES: DUF4062 domain-containing protein [unclassified Microbacterium]|uniref:DUF4062 domain-containing protein n=1 Tax=unclassified Microbacterium TaxID=2609290 RepID=UPI00214B8274|nr:MULTISPECIES: DUF4062 domain-containing protein [unclassified Microbacterium]MCR2784557.1 DUF4062 domain-containing protein [Microbacterium sp. zg.B96]WIM14633.1 DUF4062 domain-containing protein [Microbacterium sp. zg-B96]
MVRGASVIRTPDQRLRVFVSSTLTEMAEERSVVRSVIERLALTPVMFELGARPHPPRSLYRAYLEQSDIFVGLYWESYGWVAPDEQVSGLEDEYNLSPDIPRLIYVKRSVNRQDRLEGLLDRIRDDDRVSYVAFGTSDELAALVTADIAILLAERFANDRRESMEPQPELGSAATDARPPTPLTSLIGRESEIKLCSDILRSGERRLVTLTGPGGIGKTRLALAVAREVEGSFAEGTCFVDLAPIRDPALVMSAIAEALGVRDSGEVPLHQKIVHAMGQRRMLIVLDNFEQVIDAAGDLRTLLDGTDVSLLVTSRILLHIDGEQAVTVAPIPSPAAIELFVERARAIKPDFALTSENAEDVATVITAVDSVPLAIELAAARILVLPPKELIRRLDKTLLLLARGNRGQADRHSTLRATIDWSTDLLTQSERTLFRRLGVFRGSFALDAVEWMCEDLREAVALDLLSALVDGSLVQARQDTGRASFTMLATLREYAREELEQAGDLEASQQRHAAFYSQLAVQAETELVGAGQHAWIARLRAEYEDLRAAIEFYLRAEQAHAVVAIVWPLNWFWWASSRVADLTAWMSAVADASYVLDERTRRIAEFYLVSAAIWILPDPARIPDFDRLLAYFVESEDIFGEIFLRSSLALLHLAKEPPDVDAADQHLQRAQQIADQTQSSFLTSMTLLIRGQAATVRKALSEAEALFNASLQLSRDSGDALSQAGALHSLGWLSVLGGQLSLASDYFKGELTIASGARHEEGVALGLEGFFAVAALQDDLERAGTYLGAAETVRARRGIDGPSILSSHQHVLAQVESSPGAETFKAGRKAGRLADIDTIVEDALTGAASAPDPGRPDNQDLSAPVQRSAELGH